MWVLLSLLALLIAAGYLYLDNIYKYWKKRGVPHPPVSILFGNVGRTLNLSKSLGQIYTEIYNQYPDHKYVGFYKIRSPGVILRDINLIRTILIKEFASFHDNELEIDEKVDPIAAKSTFVAKGENWKIVKNQISPCFTPMKLKSMYPLVDDAAKKLMNYLEGEPDATSKEGLHGKDVFAKYSTEVVASCAFGLEANAFTDADSDFRKFGKKIFQPSPGTIFKFLIITVFPSLTSLLKIKFFTDDVVDYFRSIVSQTVKYREENGIVRNDFLDLMLELKSKLGDDFSEDDILSHALGFFTDGFETTSAVIDFTFYELSVNSDVQERLHEEIQKSLRENNGKLDYDTLLALPYLDAVFSESLRLHPPGVALLRSCTKPYTLPPPIDGSGEEVTLEVGTPVIVPVLGLHYDSTYFLEPERFDPDRFSEANKDTIIKGSYLPFGEGPRNCHGQRFGIMQAKAAIAHVVSKFEVKLNNRTIVPLELDPAHLIPYPKGGIWLNFHRRSTDD